MRSTRSLATTSLAGSMLALTLVAGAAPPLSSIKKDVANSYHSAVRVYDKARMWGVIARWWIDPEYAPAVHQDRPAGNLDDVCQVRPGSGR